MKQNVCNGRIMRVCIDFIHEIEVRSHTGHFRTTNYNKLKPRHFNCGTIIIKLNLTNISYKMTLVLLG